MNELDRRAAEAAASLRADLAEDLDVDAAYDRVLAGGGSRRTRATVGRGLVVAAAVVAVLFGIGATNRKLREARPFGGLVIILAVFPGLLGGGLLAVGAAKKD